MPVGKLKLLAYKLLVIHFNLTTFFKTVKAESYNFSAVPEAAYLHKILGLYA